MSSIPQKPVFEEDQVLTYKDLDELEGIYYYAEIENMRNGKIKDAYFACAGHRIMNKLRAWLHHGKPPLDKEGPQI